VGKSRTKPETRTNNDWFGRFATCASAWMGSKWAFTVAILAIFAWGATGQMFHFSNTWQLVINTGTTIVTFVMVFLIQNTQNRDARAINLKLDVLMSQQDDITADVTTIEAGVANLGTAAAAITAEIAALKVANPALDLTGLDKAAADLTGAVTTVAALAPPAAPPAA